MNTLTHSDERIIEAARDVTNAMNTMLELTVGISDANFDETFKVIRKHTAALTEALRVPERPSDVALEYVAQANRTRTAMMYAARENAMRG